METLRAAVAAAAVVCGAGLAAQLIRTRMFGRRRLYAAPAGDPASGVRYAFTTGMLPQAKESVMMNLPSYAAGMAFHAGVFAAAGLLLTVVAGVGVPGGLRWLIGAVAAVGSLGGAALFVKRLVTPHMRGLSGPDDFVANALSTAFAAAGGAAAFVPGVSAVWLAVATAWLLYIPLGKIRHCVFFFTTRYHFGAFFGRRGTFPTRG